MIFHIIKQNETVKDLIFKYGLDKSEIISNNQHISDWDNLIPGVKLKIPVVNNSLYEHLEEVEPFIEDYYQKESYNASEPVFVNNQSNLINDEIHQVDQVPEEITQTGDISLPVQEEPIPNSQPQEINQTGDISTAVQGEPIPNSQPQEVNQTGDISTAVQGEPIPNIQPHEIQYENDLKQNVTKEELNVNYVEQPEEIQQHTQLIQQNKVNPQVQTNNIKYPV